jgi:hypothetical protein
MFFPNMVEPVLFMYEFLAAIVAANNRVMMHFPCVFDEVVIILKFGIALVARELFSKNHTNIIARLR